MTEAADRPNARLTNSRQRLIYITMRLKELNDEKARLVAERAEVRKVLSGQRAGGRRGAQGPTED